MKILIVRFSSIGDIVLTSSVLRILKEQLENVEIHYLTKSAYRSLVANNPRVDKVYSIDSSINEIISELKEEQYDWVIDLHNNLRTRILKSKLRRPSRSFRKLNIEKWKLVRFKVNKLPDEHVVDRYIETVEHLGVKNDGRKGEFYISDENQIDMQSRYGIADNNYVSVAIGAKFQTKQMPLSLLEEVLNASDVPVVLVGGKEDRDKGEKLISLLDGTFINTCGELNIQESANVVSQSGGLLTNDTGMMHIGACFNIPIISVWGNTVPEFGMYPYRPESPESFSIHEVKGLDCRPCSKIGYDKCPKGHFKCMNDQRSEEIRIDLFKD